jgi:hypothetical protein
MVEIPSRDFFTVAAAKPQRFATSDGWQVRFDSVSSGFCAVTVGTKRWIKFEMVGDSFGIYCVRYEHGGRLAIKIDGQNFDTIDMFSPQRNERENIAFVEGLGMSRHFVELSVVDKNKRSMGDEIWIRTLFLTRQTIDLYGAGLQPADKDSVNKLPLLSDCAMIFCKNTVNVGDLKSLPALYFPFLAEARVHDVMAWHPRLEPSMEARIEFSRTLEERNIIIGGGGLLEQGHFKEALSFILAGARRKVAIWGAGHNSDKVTRWDPLYQQFSFSHIRFELIGVRDFGSRFNWVPCASCMAPEFDIPYSRKRKLGFYMHALQSGGSRMARRGIPAEDIQNNSASFADAIRFLGESETIVSDSFHGIYWATLLGCKVVGIPSTSKFFSYKHMVPLASFNDWESALPLAHSYPDALDECRAANLAFAQAVHDRFSEG